MIGDWPDPRDPRVKWRVASDLDGLLGAFDPARRQPMLQLARIAYCLQHCASVVATLTDPSAVVRALDRLGAEDAQSPLPPLEVSDEHWFGANLLHTTCRGLPAGNPTVRAMAWALMVGAAERAQLEHGPSGRRIVASTARAALISRWPDLAHPMRAAA